MRGNKLGPRAKALVRQLEIGIMVLAVLALAIFLAGFYVKSATLLWMAFSLALIAFLSVLTLTFALYFPCHHDGVRPLSVVLGSLSLALIGMSLSRISGIEQSQNLQDIFSLQPPVSSSPRPEQPTPSLSPPSLITEEAKSFLTGVVSHNGRPLGFATNIVPEFNVKQREPGQACAGLGGRWSPFRVRYTKQTGEYELELAPGDYCLWVTADAGLPLGPQATFPDDFASITGWGTDVSLRLGESRRVNIDVARFLHILKPVDNGHPIPLPSSGGELPSYHTPMSVEWEPLPIAENYVVTVLIASRFDFINDYRSVYSRRTSTQST